MKKSDAYRIFNSIETCLNGYILEGDFNTELQILRIGIGEGNTKKMKAIYIEVLNQIHSEVSFMVDYCINTNDYSLARKIRGLKNSIDIVLKKLYLERPIDYQNIKVLCQLKGEVDVISIQPNEEPENDKETISEVGLIDKSDTERSYFVRAIQAGFMEKTNNGYKWLFGGSRGQARLGYFCFKVYNQPRPINPLEKLFGVKKLSASITNAGIEPIRQDVKKWRQEMDTKIFF